MKLTLESTDKLVSLRAEEGRVPARIWEGQTESGIKVHCFITRVAVADLQSPDVYGEFERELSETRAPSPEVEAIPLRFVL